MSASSYTVAFVECDHPGCGTDFDCVLDDLAKTRNEAEARWGWRCNAEMDTDLCPEHAPTDDESTDGPTKPETGEAR